MGGRRPLQHKDNIDHGVLTLCLNVSDGFIMETLKQGQKYCYENAFAYWSLAGCQILIINILRRTKNFTKYTC